MMKNTKPLRYNYEFSRVYRRGTVLFGRHLTIHFFKRPKGLKHYMTRIPPDINRIGFTANRKIKGAVRRNRSKRLLRESFRGIADKLPLGFDLIIMMRYADPLPKFSEVQEEMSHLLNRMIRKGKNEYHPIHDDSTH